VGARGGVELGVAVPVGGAEADTEEVDDTRADRVRPAELVAESDGDAVREGNAVREGDRVDVGLAVAELDEDALCVTEGVRAAVKEPDITAKALLDRLAAPEAEAEAEADAVAV